jgi:hypothetical protein
LIVRQNLTLRQAAQQLGQDVTPQEADNTQGRIPLSGCSRRGPHVVLRGDWQKSQAHQRRGG